MYFTVPARYTADAVRLRRWGVAMTPATARGSRLRGGQPPPTAVGSAGTPRHGHACRRGRSSRRAGTAVPVVSHATAVAGPVEGEAELMSADDIMVFAGSTSRRLAARICEYLQITPGRNETLQFSDGNTFVRVLDNVRGRRVYVVQSTIFPTNDAFMELLFWIDAFKRASAEAVTAVIPYFSYGKGDKKDEPRVSIRARVCADAIEAAGADRVVTIDLHTPQIQGFFHVPVDNLYALPVLCDRIRAEKLANPIVVSPDTGF